jgi:hypothetical protein
MSSPHYDEEKIWMIITVDYRVDRGLYYSAEHCVTLVTTEYICNTDILAHVMIGKSLGVRLNDLMRHEFGKDVFLQNEQFFAKKTYKMEEIRPITRGTFEEKQKRFDISQTIIEQETVEVYYYTDKSGTTDSVEIVVREKDSKMTAEIEFNNPEQRQTFIYPAWLMDMTAKTI